MIAHGITTMYRWIARSAIVDNQCADMLGTLQWFFAINQRGGLSDEDKADIAEWVADIEARCAAIREERH